MKKQYLRFQGMLFLILMFLFTLFSGKALAQSTLSLGDISIIGINANTPDNFTFVTWVDLLNNTEIRFTDNGFSAGSNSSTTGIYRDQEQYVTWKNNTGATIPAGTVVVITGATSPMTTSLGQIVSILNSSGSAATSMSLINTSGDQIFAFQGAGAVAPGNTTTSSFSGNILFAIGYSGSAVASTGWLTSGTISGSTSYLPSNVTGNSSVFLGPNVAGGQYTGARTGLVNFAAYKALIANPANWTTVGGASVTPAFTTTAFSTGAVPAITTQPTDKTICNNGNTTFTGAASNATSYQWQVSTGSTFVDITDGGIYSGATTATLTITGATSTVNGYQYRLVATATGSSVNSNAATLNVISITTTGSQTNVACNGGSTGAASVTPTGGTAPYTYSWVWTSGGGAVVGTGASITNRPVGAYTVTVTDANLCTATRNFTIVQPTAVSGTRVITNVSCFGGTNGAINLTPTGGTGPYTFNWGGGITTEDRTGLAGGSYSVTITDANGCTGTVNATVTQPAAAVSGTTVVTNITCFSGTNGAINLTPTGGTGPYTFNWGGGIATEDRTGLAAGSYSVTITDVNGCTGTVNATVTQPAAAVSGTTVVTNITCFSGTNGAINLTPTGGTGPYTFNWGGGITTEDRTGLVAGSYSVTITDANGCTGTVNATVTQPATAVSGTRTITNVSCFGGTNGTINLTPAGGTGPYTFNWGGGITTEDRTGLVAGSYTVTITDANGCTGTVNATVTQPATAVSGTTVVTNVSCNGGTTGSINLTPTGGTGPYTFNWGGGITTEDRTGLAVGNYSVTITDVNGCTGTVNATVTQPAAITATTAQTNVSCYGGTNATATVTPTGGTAPYTYSWSPLGGTAATASGLTSGTYNVTITDANTCAIIKTVTITQPAAFSITTAQTNVSCNGGSNGTASVTVTGGTPGYTYSWSPSGGTAATATGLVSGTYTVTITDANTCQTTRTVTITQPATAVSGTTVVTNVACNGGTTGSINLTPTGGTGPYTFNWGGGITTEDRTGLAAGNYSVTITDVNGCTGTVNATVAQPAAITATTSQTNVSCNGGTNATATVTPTGGTAPYTYSWSPLGGTAATASGLASGTYTVTVTDANGCSIPKVVTITQPAAITATTSQTNVSCYGGTNATATVTPTGGTAPYTYSWSPLGGTAATASGLTSGTYNVTITDANTCAIIKTVTITQPAAFSITTAQTNVSCNGGSNGTASVTVTGGTPGYTYSWSPSGGTAAIATGLVSGTYTVTITDANTCQTTRTVTITQPATAVSGTTVVTNVACNGGTTGSINLTPTGGTGPYTFNWGGGITTEDRTGLAAGSYSVTITDVNGCTGIVNATVTQPTAITATTAQTNVSCNGGSNGTATVSPTGGTGAYTYSWAPLGGTAATASGLASGTYTVTVTDANGCSIPKVVTITQPTALAATAGSQTNVSCFGGTNASATVNVTGGTGSYTYSWAPSGGTAATASGLAAGTYTVTATDANGCTAVQSFTITQPAALAAAPASQTNVSCFGGTNASATVNVTGGTGTYTYSWAPSGGTAATASGLAAGTYTVTATDANGCTAVQSFTITQPAALAATAGSQTNVSCFGGTNASATVNITGGTGTYTYSWAPSGGTAATASGLAAGTYTVTATDANGCTAVQSFTITQPAALAATAGSQTNVSCFGGTNASATVNITGGTGTYTYSWAPSGGTAATATGLAAGTYTVTATDANGCTAVQSFTITQPAALAAAPASQTNVSCFGGTNASATVSVTGGTGSYTYSWAPSGGTAATASGLAAGTYTVTATDANGCTAVQSFTITQPTAITATTSQVNIACNGAAAGSASVTATGGTGAYTYAWSPSGGTAATATGLTAGNYAVIITDANGCSITKNFTITEAAAINVTLQPAAAAAIEGTTASFTVTASNATSYQWQVSTNGTTWADVSNGGTNPVYAGATTNTLTLTGVPIAFNGYSYRVKVSSSASCSVNSNAAILTVTPDLKTEDFSRIAVSIYPNPASSQVFIKIPEISSHRNCTVAVYDLNGRMVIQKRLASESETIDIANLQQGVYIFNITSDSAKTTKRVVKN